MARGKRYKTATAGVDRDKTYPLEEAVKIVKAMYIRSAMLSIGARRGADVLESDQ